MTFAMFLTKSGTLSKHYLCDGKINVQISVAQETAVEMTRCNIRLIEVQSPFPERAIPKAGKVLQNEVNTLRSSEF